MNSTFQICCTDWSQTWWQLLNVFFRLISGNNTTGVCVKTAIGVCQWIHTGYFSIGSGGGLAPCGVRPWSGTVLTYACNDISPLVLGGGLVPSGDVPWPGSVLLDICDEMSVLVRVVAWCYQAPCHGLSQC